MWLRLGGGSEGLWRSRSLVLFPVYVHLSGVEVGLVLADASQGRVDGEFGGLARAWPSVLLRDADGPGQSEVSLGHQDLLLGDGEGVVAVSILMTDCVGVW